MKILSALFLFTTIFFSLNSFAEDVKDEPVISNPVHCELDATSIDQTYDAFKKSSQKEIQAANSVQWFMGPQKAEIYSREEKITKMYKDFKGNKAPNDSDGTCYQDLLQEKMDKSIETSKKNIEAITYADNKKDGILKKNNCYDLNNYSCAIQVFKVYTERKQQSN